MGVLFIVLPLALVFAAGAVVAFIFSVRTGQFDDLTTPAHRILHDEEAGAKGTSTGTGEAARSKAETWGIVPPGR